MNMTQTLTSVEIPIIDLAPFVDGNQTDQHKVAQEIYQACHTIGFIYLKNHGVDPTLLEKTFAQSQQFFSLPLAIKQQLAWDDEVSNRGYLSMQREQLNPDRPGDAKEALNVGREDKTSANPALTQNRWLDEDQAFRDTVLALFAACTETANRVFRAFALALGLPESFISDRHVEQEFILRLLHYPPIVQAIAPGQIRAGEHSDYGSVTLLFQDQVGGLEVQTADGDWISAPCIPDTLLVNTGDLMERWSNHVFRSTQHRVSLPTDDRRFRSRYSIAFFCQPDYDVEIACLPTCQSADNPPRYAPVLSGDYLLSRLQAAYSR
ncbi:isopenicillin N synthase family dioxygenase [Phormidesmis priestleyi]